MSVTAAAEALEDALRTIPDLRVHRDPGANMDPPVAVVMVPRLVWEAHGPGAPTDAVFMVYVAVTADDRAIERLWSFADSVPTAIDRDTDAVVTRADPGTLPTGGTELPALEFTVEYPL